MGSIIPASQSQSTRTSNNRFVEGGGAAVEYPINKNLDWSI